MATIRFLRDEHGDAYREGRSPGRTWRRSDGVWQTVGRDADALLDLLTAEESDFADDVERALIDIAEGREDQPWRVQGNVMLVDIENGELTLFNTATEHEETMTLADASAAFRAWGQFKEQTSPA